jgi:uncharacterized protein (TIGR00369 family)
MTEQQLQEFAAEFVRKDGLGALVGARFVSLSPDECVYEYDAHAGHHNPYGTLHGGALFSVMDSSQGLLVGSTLESCYSVAATGTATIKYLAPVRSETIRVRTKIVRREGRKIFVHTDAVSAEGKVVAVLEEIWIAIPKSFQSSSDTTPARRS